MDLRRVEDGCRQLVADDGRELRQQRACKRQMLVGRQAEAETELGVVLEQRVRPCRSAALMIDGPGRHRQAAAVDRRAAGRIGDLRAVAEQL